MLTNSLPKPIPATSKNQYLLRVSLVTTYNTLPAWNGGIVEVGRIYGWTCQYPTGFISWGYWGERLSSSRHEESREKINIVDDGIRTHDPTNPCPAVDAIREGIGGVLEYSHVGPLSEACKDEYRRLNLWNTQLTHTNYWSSFINWLLIGQTTNERPRSETFWTKRATLNATHIGE